MDEIKVGQRYQVGPNTVGTVEFYDVTTGLVKMRIDNNEEGYHADSSGLYPFTADIVKRIFTQIGESKDGWVKRIVKWICKR